MAFDSMLPFREMPYERPDMATLEEAYQRTAEILLGAASYNDARKAFFDLQALETGVDTCGSIAMVRNTIDTSDPFYEAEVKWLREKSAALIPAEKKMKEALMGSPWRKEFEAEFGAQLFRMIASSLKTSDKSIIEDTVREGELTQKYQKDSALASTVFRGETCNFYALLKHMESTDRAERREAYLAWSGLYESISGALDQTYDELISVRRAMAGKLGFQSYTDLAYLKRRRFDYTKEDAARFRAQVLEWVTPAVARIREKQRKRLGLERLSYYDEALLFPGGNPEPRGDRDTLVRKASEMYREMSAETGEFFDFMTRYGLFDLESRPGKRMGGYMTSFPGYKAPFIFSNFNGTSADVDVLTHEAGHAFQGYLAMRSIPVSMLSSSTSEINEVHSMSMEHFAYPWMDKFFGEKSGDYVTAHLIGALSVIPYMCCVDEFQHRVYETPVPTARERRVCWRKIEKKYMPWRDYDDVPFLEEGGFWMQKQHIFLYPFYYIDYALAQMCAFQFYSRMKTDREGAWQDYLRLCRAGGTKGYFDLLKVGNLENPLLAGSVEKCVSGVIAEIDERY